MIVAHEWPGQEYQANGRTVAARALLSIIEHNGPALCAINIPVLREGLDLTQGARHGLADDEFASINESHIAALSGLDEHPALRFLSTAEASRSVDDAVWRAFSDRAGKELPFDPKDRMEVPEPENCDECWRPTFLPSDWDWFAGTDSPGICIACGYERSVDVADDRAITEAIRRAMEKDT